MKQTTTNWRSIYLGVGVTTLATLLLELALTRIFSVVFYYHFAFLAISIALFGLGAGGVFSYVLAGRGGNFYSKLGAIAAFNGALVVGALVFLLTRQGQPGYGTLAMVYLLSALPFFGAGTVLALVIGETIERVNRVYFADLIGAAAGCLLLIPALNCLGGPNTVLLAGLLYAISGAIWYTLAGARKLRLAVIGLSVAFAVLIGVNLLRPVIDVKYAKGKALKNETFVKWNSFSRIAVQGRKGDAMIFIDADASTGIAPFDFTRPIDDRATLLYEGPGLPYALHPGAKTLIIGPGGGWDVARALASGSHDVTGVEINPIIATTVMRERFPDYSHGLYNRPEVRIVIEDGRSFARRSTEKYQVVQATLVDTWASTAAGAFALSENNLYTTDAFHDYLSHLTDDGMLVFTRWGLQPPRESLRLISLAIDALRGLGETEPWRNILAVREGTADELARWGAQDTVVIFRKPITAGTLARFHSILPNTKYVPIYSPDANIPGPFTALLHTSDRARFERDYQYDISAVGDNRPFFFYTVQPHDLWNFFRHASKLSADYKINRAVPLLFGLLGVSLLATLVILLLPRLLLGSRLPSEKGVLGFLWYFIFIGAGYILIQVALVQKFVLFLGHPTYALTVIIFSMLISSGVGSFYSQRVMADSPSRWRSVLAAIAALVAVLAFSVSGILGNLVGLPLALKFALSAALIAPAGFLMGMPFPTGLHRLERMHKPSVRWAWSLNAAASVLGSVGAIMLAIYLGLRETLLVGGLMYLCAMLAIRVPAAERAAESQAEALEETAIAIP
ncbi:MAG: hypothetical protein ABSG25_00630 [Bryobacteraceae bacterium]